MMAPIAAESVILLIDDDPLFRYLIERYGHESACRVISAPDIDSARPLMRHTHPALVLLQIDAADGAGWDVVRALKTDPDFNHLPVAVCGSVTKPAWEWDADYWLSKPVMFNDFLAILLALGLVRPTPNSSDDPPTAQDVP